MSFAALGVLLNALREQLDAELDRECMLRGSALAVSGKVGEEEVIRGKMGSDEGPAGS